MMHDDIEDMGEANPPSSDVPAVARTTPIHRFRKDKEETPLLNLPHSLLSPYESERKSSSKLGALRLKLSKVHRLTDADEARMVNLHEFQACDMNDPRAKASRIMDLRVLHNGVGEDPPFVAISCEVVSDVSVNDTVSGFVGLSAGVKLTAYFKPSLIQANLHKLTEGGLIRLFNPVIVSSAVSEIMALCTQVFEMIH